MTATGREFQFALSPTGRSLPDCGHRSPSNWSRRWSGHTRGRPSNVRWRPPPSFRPSAAS